LSQKIGSRYASELIKGYTDTDYSLDSKYIWLGWRPVRGNYSQKGEKTCLHCDVTSRNLKPNPKK